MTVRTFLLVVSPLLLLSAALGFVAAEARARPKPPTIYWPEDVVQEMRSLVEETYVDEVSEAQARELFYAACKAYLAGLDPYCDFYTPEERKSLEQETRGQFGGVGILGLATPGGILVQGARHEDPAWKVGIRAGDHIVAVDGVETTTETASEVLGRLRGAPGTAVRVAWLPAAGGDRREAEVTRDRIKIDSVMGVAVLDGEAGIGYLRIARFQENTAQDLRAALRLLRKDGARSFILDLRSDYGGVLNAAVASADAFLSEGVVVHTKGRGGIEKPLHVAGPDPEDELEATLLVLVDGATASASEILAGALQDHGRAVLVGERTYGKFLVQRIVPLQGAEHVAVRLTTARYFTPFLRNLQRNDARNVRGGLIPEVPVPVSDAHRKAVEAWFRDQVGLDWDVVPGLTSDRKPTADPVLDRAVALLRDDAVVQKAMGR